MIFNQDDKKRKYSDDNKGIKEQKERKKIKRLIWGTAAVILAGGIAGGAAMHYSNVQRERKEAIEKAQEASRKKEEAEKEMEEKKTPEEEKAEEIAQVKEQARAAGCPEEIIGLIDHNDETLDFVKDYAEKKDDPVPDTVEADTGNGAIPHYLQWDERWGYASYGTSTIASSGCGPTCMSMVIVGLTGDTTATPYRLAKYSEENGYIDQSNNTYWAFLDAAARQWGLTCREGMMDETTLAAELAAGHPVICSMLPGDFTDGGHFIVLTGYDNGQVTLNDPFSIRNTQKKWNFADISGQIREMWVVSNG